MGYFHLFHNRHLSSQVSTRPNSGKSNLIRGRGGSAAGSGVRRVESGENGVEIVLMIEPSVGIVVGGADSLFVILHFDFDVLGFPVLLRPEAFAWEIVGDRGRY